MSGPFGYNVDDLADYERRRIENASAAAASSSDEVESASAGFDPNDHTVAEVRAHLADDPGDLARVVALEAAGKNRSSVIALAD